MSRKDFLDDLLNVAKGFKDHLWEDHHQRDMQAAIGLLTDAGLHRVPPNLVDKLTQRCGSVSDVLDQLMQGVTNGQAPIKMADVLGIVVIADAYTYTGDADEPSPFGGSDDDSLMESFFNDPNTPVVEAITVYFAERDVVGGCAVHLVRLAYHLDDGGVLVWDDKPFYIIPDDEPNSDGFELGGRIYEVFRKYLHTEGLA